MGQDFFTEVTGPIPFGGLESTDPLAFKVYQPDRLVLGKRMDDHLRTGRLLLALVRVARRRHVRRRARSTGRGSTAADDPMAAAREQDGGRVRVLRQARRPVLLLPRPRRRPRGHDASPSSSANLDAIADDALGLPGADRRPACCGAPPTCSRHPRYQARRGHQPRSRGVRLRRRAGEAHARGDPAARRRELRPVGRPRGLRDAAQHRPRSARATSSPASCTWSPSTSTRSASRARS